MPVKANATIWSSVLKQLYLSKSSALYERIKRTKRKLSFSFEFMSKQMVDDLKTFATEEANLLQFLMTLKGMLFRPTFIKTFTWLNERL